MSSRKRDGERLNPFSGEDKSLETVADEIYGAPASGPDTGRVVARPIAIGEIWADARQPRRAVPVSIRLHWNGSPEAVPALLEQWHKAACKASGREVDVYEVLQGRGEGISTEGMPALFVDYLELVRLAASIATEGLINPIRVIKQRERWLIESGERRWLAHWLLKEWMGETTWNRIAAVEGDGRGMVWKQAAENTQRRALNAVGMARQLALLIMDAREGLDGQHYDDFDDLVLPGECDRRFYAQVANGNIHRIPRGMGERIQAAMGLSEKRLADYRRLLRLTNDEVINDALWIKGDVENWAEGAFRNIADTLPIGKVREVMERDEWTLDDLRGLAMEPITPKPSPPAPPSQGEGKTTTWAAGTAVITPTGHVGTVINQVGRLVYVQGPNGTRPYDATLLRPAVPQQPQPPASAPQSIKPSQTAPPSQGIKPSPLAPLPQGEGMKAADVFEVGWAVQIDHTGQVGEIVAVKDDMVQVAVDGDPGLYTLREVTDLGMTFESFVGMEVEEGVTWENAPAPPAPSAQSIKPSPPALRPQGIKPSPPPPLPEGEGDTGADNAVSVFRVGGQEYMALSSLVSTARNLGDDEAAQVLEEMRDFTTGDARRLAEMGKLGSVVNAYYDHMGEAMQRWLTEFLVDVLTQIEQAGQ